MIRAPLSLAFKGGRNYLQGPDLLAGLLDALARLGRPVDAAIKVGFYRKTGTQPDVGLLEAADPAAQPADAIGHWSAASRGTAMRGWYLASDRPVEARAPYDEDSVVADCVRDDSVITFRGATELSAVELCVAMTKAMHNALFPLPATQHWVVSQMAFARPLGPEDRAGMQIALGARLGSRLTRSAVRSAATALGDVFFSPADR